jgi:hypothetical protein
MMEDPKSRAILFRRKGREMMIGLMSMGLPSQSMFLK